MFSQRVPFSAEFGCIEFYVPFNLNLSNNVPGNSCMGSYIPLKRNLSELLYCRVLVEWMKYTKITVQTRCIESYFEQSWKPRPTALFLKLQMGSNTFETIKDAQIRRIVAFILGCFESEPSIMWLFWGNKINDHSYLTALNETAARFIQPEEFVISNSPSAPVPYPNQWLMNAWLLGRSVHLKVHNLVFNYWKQRPMGQFK